MYGAYVSSANVCPRISEKTLLAKSFLLKQKFTQTPRPERLLALRFSPTSPSTFLVEIVRME